MVLLHVCAHAVVLMPLYSYCKSDCYFMSAKIAPRMMIIGIHYQGLQVKLFKKIRLNLFDTKSYGLKLEVFNYITSSSQMGCNYRDLLIRLINI